MSTSRTRILGLLFISALLMVWGRVAYLELALGPWYRATLTEGEVRTRLIPAPRGTIRAADGTELARDRCDADLAVHYRYLERPIDDAWLDRQARVRLTRRERRDPDQVEQAKHELRNSIECTWKALAELTGSEEDILDARARTVQGRVQRIVESVNRRRHDRWAEAQRRIAEGTGRPDHEDTPGIWNRLCDWLADRPAHSLSEPPPVTVVEQNRYFTLVEDISPEVLLEFTSHPERFPGVCLKQRIRREYPQHELASAVIGYTEPDPGGGLADDEFSQNSGNGRTGVEGFYDSQLSGSPGHVREQIVGGGGAPRVLGGRPPQPGRDLTLTLDLKLERVAEDSLERALTQGVEPTRSVGRASSGAIILMSVRTGAVLVAASAPRFDLNVPARPGSTEAQALASQADSPLFNRVVQMSLPPGSAFKPVTALAGLKQRIDPRETYYCRGYLHEPDKFRCLIYRHYGVGHEAVNMTDAIVRSCNVYFFHLSERIGWEEIVHWGDAFGFGRRTGIDLAGEEAGSIPNPASLPRRGRVVLSEGEMKGLAIGQGSLLATPIQVARMMAAIANGGQLVVPHVRRDAFQPPRAIAGLNPQDDRMLAVVRHALDQVVADPRGTAHEHLFLREIEIAGKTGTAQSGSARGDHAWFAGYVPAKNPEFAIVAVLEHAGSGGHAAGPLARDLVQWMLELGYFSTGKSSSADEMATSPGARR